MVVMELSLIPAAFLAGILMFLAPCTLPIVPGYLAFISGSVASGSEKSKVRGRLLINALAFVLGFSVVFILLGTSAGFLGSLLGPWRNLASRLGGAVIILFGLTMLGLLRLPALSSEHHIRLPKFLTLGRFESSMLVGALFALGWSPCIGPILGTILFLASGSATAASGALLLAVFSLGLGLPFILTALLMRSGQNAFGNWGTASKILSYVGGCVLILLGVLMLAGETGLLVSWGFRFFEGPYDQLLKYM